MPRRAQIARSRTATVAMTKLDSLDRFEGGTHMKLWPFDRDNTVRMSSTIKTAAPDASQALEQAWLKRRQELAGWEPSRGWLVDQKSTRRPLAGAR